MTNPSKPAPRITHGAFTIERTYPHSPAKVFRAHSDMAAKRRWFVEGDGFEVLGFEMDFRPGGEEVSRFRFGDGPEISNETQFHFIDPDRRIVFGYRMAMGQEPISASIATIDLEPAGSGTRMVFTEQGAYFGDDPDVLKNREEGSRGLLEALAAELDRQA